ncbi:hypothetical protein C7974DRAFT_418219 [Boeremia exigua]|uniref:uncharacterized protein n=1 Tax=Boeremia exigua TaxID=749465 RepID=UPI001E8CAD82|nr:uncharacterized protein C7974DRAFT_418219 [Boeremia exigua]KAH6613132.1 hypothetical protein C7974DRAFT_418219 [Boeremia exigua]
MPSTKPRGRKAAVARPGYTMQGFKIRKPGGKSRNQLGAKPRSTTAIGSAADATLDVREPAAPSRSTGQKTTSQRTVPSIFPSVPGPSKTPANKTTQGSSSKSFVIDLTEDSTTKLLQASSDASAFLGVQNSGITGCTPTNSRSMSGEDLANAAIPHTHTSQPTVSLAVRSGSSRIFREGSSRCTPSYVRQLRDAAQSPNTSFGQSEPVDLDLGAATARSEFVFEMEGLRTEAVVDVSRRERDLISTIEPSCAAVALHGFPRKNTLGLSFTSTAPQLIASNAEYDEYVSTTTYRVPHESAFVSPQISVTMSTSKLSCLSHADRTHRSQSGALSKQRKAPLLKTSESEKTEYLQDGDFIYRKVPRCKPVRARTPTPYSRRTPFYHLTSNRSKMPIRQPTPAPHGMRKRQTQSPGPHSRCTPRRKETWRKLTSKMTENQRRRPTFPRRSMFTQAIQEPHVTLPPLERYWEVLSNLITDKKLFSRDMFDHWEYLETCTRVINGNLIDEEAFGRKESCAIARELMKQRFIMFSGGNKVMLTPNAGCSRLS